MNLLDVEVRLYGAFRDFSEAGCLEFSVPPGGDLALLRDMLRAQLEILRPEVNAGDLLEKSVFADAEGILEANYIFESSQSLSVIPPVCGG